MAGKRFTQHLLGVKIIKETTPGTFLAPTQSLCLERGASSPKVQFATFECDPMAPTSGWKHTIVSPGSAVVEYEITQKMSDNKADYVTLLEACNFEGTAVTAPDGTSYQMKSTSPDTLSIEWIDPRATLKGRGGKGAFTLKAEINQPVEIGFGFKFTYEGEVLLAATDPDNSIAAAAIPELLYLIEDCGSCSINGASGHFESFSIDWGTNIVKKDTTCPSSAFVQEYAPTVTIKQSLTEENEASWEELKSGTSKNIVIGLFNSAGTKRGEVRIPKATPTEIDKDGEDGVFVATKTFACMPTVGDDNVQIVIFD